MQAYVGREKTTKSDQTRSDSMFGHNNTTKSYQNYWPRRTPTFLVMNPALTMTKVKCKRTSVEKSPRNRTKHVGTTLWSRKVP